MASRQAQRRYAYVLSVLAHAAIVAMLTFSIPLTNRNPTVAGPVAPIETYMIDTAELEAEMARIEAAEEAERLRQQQEAERVRQEQEAQQRELERVQREREAAEQEAERERIRVQQEAEAERLRLAEVERERAEAERRAEEERLERERQEEIARQEEERQRQEELARRREEDERRRREAEEAARLAAIEADIQRSIAAEREAQAARDSGLREQWSLAIQRRVEQYWNRPPNVDPNLECVLIVTQLPDGTVTQVTMERCTTNDQTIIRSVENAVLNASPLPQRPNGVPFERQIRIRFIPTE